MWSPNATTTQETAVLLADSLALKGKKLTNGVLEVDGSPPPKFTREEADAQMSIWDGDDMTLEMLTDVNDGEVDEDVSQVSRLLFYRHNQVCPT